MDHERLISHPLTDPDTFLYPPGKALELAVLPPRRRGAAVYFEWSAEDSLIDALIDKAAAERFGRPNPRGILDLGTSASTRHWDDILRDATRRTTCIECGGLLPPGSRSNRVVCSKRCQKRKDRHEDSLTSATGVERSMGPTR